MASTDPQQTGAPGIKSLPLTLNLKSKTDKVYRDWARNFLKALIEISLESTEARTKGLLEERKIWVWFGENTNPIELTTSTKERENSTQDTFFFPTDAVNIFYGLAKELDIHLESPEQIFLKAKNHEGKISETKLALSQELYKLFGHWSELNAKLNEFDREGQEAKTTEKQEEEVVFAQPPHDPATAKVAVAGGGGGKADSQDDTGGADATAPPADNQTLDRAEPTLTAEQKKALVYESAWLYHHAAFELFGEAGFVKDDPRFVILQKEIDEYLQKSLSPEQVQEGFANPAKRLEYLRNVYTRLAGNREFAQWQALATAQAAELDEKIPQFGKSTGDEKKLAQAVIEQELEKKLNAGVLIIDGSVLGNLSRTIDSMALAMGNPSLAKQLGLNPDEQKNTQQFLDSLTPDKLILIFFSGKHDQAYLEWAEANASMLKAVLAGAITARSIEIYINTGSKKVLMGLATETDWQNFASHGSPSLLLDTRQALAELEKHDGDSKTLVDALEKDSKRGKKDFDHFILKVWTSLSPEAQTWAYVTWLGLKPDDLSYQRDSQTGKLPFNPLLLGIDWNTFVKNARKLDELLKKLQSLDGDREGLQSIVRAMNDLNVSSRLRDDWIKQFFGGLTKGQTAYLAGAKYLRSIEQTLDWAERTLASSTPLTQDWANAVVVLNQLQRVMQANKLDSQLDPALVQKYQTQIQALQTKQSEILEKIAQAEKGQEVVWTITQITQQQQPNFAEIALILENLETAQQDPNPAMAMMAGDAPLDLLADAENYNQETSGATNADGSPLPAIKNTSLAGNMAKMANAAKALKNIPAALAGNPVAIANLLKEANSFLSNPENRKKIREVLGGIVGGGIGALLSIISQIMGVVGTAGGVALGAIVGGTAGFIIGAGPWGAVIGAGIGAGLGGSIGNKLATQYALNGVADLTPSQASQLGLQGQPANAASAQTISQASQTSYATQPTTVAAQYAPAASSASAAPIVGSAGGFGALAFLGPVFGIFGVYLMTIITMLTIFSAFLIPLPVGDGSLGGTNQSAHLTLTKLALPQKLDNGQTADVKYLITIRPTRGHKITILDVQDKIEFSSNKKEQPSSKNPSLEPSANYLPTYPKESLEKQTELNYTIKFTGGQDVLVRNVLTIKYQAQNQNGEVVADNQTLTTQALVSIGNPKVQCWPTSGEITQLPYDGFSHDQYDAYDIAADIGTAVFAPFDGEAYFEGSIASSGYGLFVTLKTTSGHVLRFAHLSKVASGIPKLGLGQKSLVMGDKIGEVGNSGKSSGQHLHYERVGSYQGGKKNRVLETLVPSVPSKPFFGQRVYSCF